MRLIQVLHGWPPEAMGGTGLYVKALAHALEDLGHEVVIASPGRGLRPHLKPVEEGGLRGWRIIQPPALTWRAAWERGRGLKLWQELLDKEQPDRVHVHHLSDLPLGLVQASRAAGIPVTLTLHDYWLPCHRGQLVDRALDPCEGPSPLGCARCATGQRTPSHKDKTRATERSTAAAEVLEAADWLLSPSEDLANRMEAMGLPRPGICPLPLVHPPAPETDPGTGHVRFLFASSIIPTKGPQHLLRAFAGLPPGPSLTLAGHAPAYDGHPDFAAELIAEASRNPAVDWRGAISATEVSALMAQHDVLVLPSTWPENSPLVVREATAAGLRVIASSLGGAAELAPDASLVDPGDVSALQEALAREAARGRKRAARREWQTPRAHAQWLLTNHPGEDEVQFRD